MCLAVGCDRRASPPLGSQSLEIRIPFFGAENVTPWRSFICTERQEGETELSPHYNNAPHTFPSYSLQALAEGPGCQKCQIPTAPVKSRQKAESSEALQIRPTES